VISAIALAERLLGARAEDTPAAGRAGSLPGWLIRAVLRNWSRGTGTSHLAPVFDALVAHRRHPRLAWAEARRRWDRPIEATLEVGGAFNHLPRWLFQVAAVARRTPELLRTLRRPIAPSPHHPVARRAARGDSAWRPWRRQGASDAAGQART
jgi:hypothetical protein